MVRTKRHQYPLPPLKEKLLAIIWSQYPELKGDITKTLDAGLAVLAGLDPDDSSDLQKKTKPRKNRKVDKVKTPTSSEPPVESNEDDEPWG